MKQNCINFSEVHCDKDILVEYHDLLEICQGGPITGFLTINGKKLGNYRFGGPMLVSDNLVFVSLYKTGLFKSGFKVVKIDSYDMGITELSPLKDIIIINKLKNGCLYYFSDMKGDIEEKICLNV